MQSVRGEGPIPARILICGEAPGEREVAEGHPFVGASGQELNRMLGEAGIMRTDCYVTNVCRVRPADNDINHFISHRKTAPTERHVFFRGKWVTPEIVSGYAELKMEIEMVKPNIIIACGNLALWALTGEWGITKWRGSQMRSADFETNVIPTIHPAAVLREWKIRAAVVNDLRRVKRHMTSRIYENIPKWNFIVRPSFDTVRNIYTTVLAMLGDGHHPACSNQNVLGDMLYGAKDCPICKGWKRSESPVWLDFDIETKHGHIDCFSFSWSHTDAICIPLFGRGQPHGYWAEAEEAQIIHWTYKLLCHPNARVRWQNGLYDAQYVHKHWHFIPNHAQDTMISQHSVFCAQPKGLAYIASMYCDYYYYWKDEGKIASNEPEEKRWRYNCQDCVYTREAGEVLLEVREKMGLTAVDQFQQSLFMPVLKAMILGAKVRPELRGQMALDIQEELSKRETFLYSVLGHSINPRSPKQMQALFYDDLKQPKITKRNPDGSHRLTVDDEALTRIAAKEPLLKPLCNAIADIRTLGKFLNDFVLMRTDDDGRMRCSFNIAGDAGGKSAPYSYRLSSSENAFGNGGNLQTIPSEKSKSSGKAAARGSMDFALPNIRAMYGPDPGFTDFDMDLDRADLQVVVWETDDEILRTALRMGVDIHLLNVYTLDGTEPPDLAELVEGHPRYADHRGPRKHKREFSKVFCHATNYVGSAKTVAAHTGRLIHEVDRAQRIWFSAHPGIKRWHERTELQITRHRFVENRFGYRWYMFDRLEGLLPEAVAWVPQSTVGGVINRIWQRISTELPEVQIKLQVHDSLYGMFPSHKPELLERIRELSKIVIPYPEPLIIPTGIKVSNVSWGDCS